MPALRLKGERIVVSLFCIFVVSFYSIPQSFLYFALVVGIYLFSFSIPLALCSVSSDEHGGDQGFYQYEIYSKQ